MNAMILAAGLGTRLKPWTLSHPKALVPVGGVPMLERVILKLKSQGFDNIVVNVHHFSGQVIDFLKSNDFGVDIRISDESGGLLDTGGGLARARSLVDFGNGPLLVHNVDILSDADLGDLMKAHARSGNDATLLVSDRASTRKLIFDGGMMLRGWHDLRNDVFRPAGFRSEPGFMEYAFSGIHVLGESALDEIGSIMGKDCFPVMDYYLCNGRKCKVGAYAVSNLNLIDIGKPATLSQAENML
jgi:mannose-1-phosphate guanyltransferase